MPRIDGIAHVAFDHNHNLRSREFIISWLNHTPHATAVYASCSASPPPHATLATRRLAKPYLGRTCTADRASFAWRLRLFDHFACVGERCRPIAIRSFRGFHPAPVPCGPHSVSAKKSR